jgi:hypothetical protein
MVALSFSVLANCIRRKGKRPSRKNEESTKCQYALDLSIHGSPASKPVIEESMPVMQRKRNPENQNEKCGNMPYNLRQTIS